MCRNIKMLHNFEPPATEAEIRAASLQFVRKITGFNTPSKANEKAFSAAVDEVARISGTLLASLERRQRRRTGKKRLLKRERELLRDSTGEFQIQG